jgi:predicted dehydrogenase
MTIVEPSLAQRFILSKLTRCPIKSRLSSEDLVNADMAFIFTPPHTHFEIAKQCLESNVHVFIEKPLSILPDHSRQLVAQASAQGLVMQVGYVYRFHPAFIAFKAKLESFKRSNKVNSASVTMKGNVKKSNGSWRSAGPASGCVLDYGSHILDLTSFFFEPCELVSANVTKRSNCVDAFTAQLQAPEGFEVSVNCDWQDEACRKAEVSVQVDFTSGDTLGATSANQVWLNDDSLNLTHYNVDFYLRGEDFANQLRSFTECVRESQVISKRAFVDIHAAHCDVLVSEVMETCK